VLTADDLRRAHTRIAHEIVEKRSRKHDVVRDEKARIDRVCRPLAVFVEMRLRLPAFAAAQLALMGAFTGQELSNLAWAHAKLAYVPAAPWLEEHAAASGRQLGAPYTPGVRGVARIRSSPAAGSWRAWAGRDECAQSLPIKVLGAGSGSGERLQCKLPIPVMACLVW
jgi:hypothetical protein